MAYSTLVIFSTLKKNTVQQEKKLKKNYHHLQGKQVLFLILLLHLPYYFLSSVWSSKDLNLTLPQASVEIPAEMIAWIQNFLNRIVFSLCKW